MEATSSTQELLLWHCCLEFRNSWKCYRRRSWQPKHSDSTGVSVPTLICDAGWLPAPPARPRPRPVLLQNGTSRRPTRTDHMREQRPRCVIERRFVVRQCSVAALVGWSQFIRILWWPSQASVLLGVARWQCSTDASSMKSL